MTYAAIAIGANITVSAAPTLAVVTGGTTVSDATYYYTTFKTSGSNELIIANASLDVSMLSIGGGGNGTASALFGGAGAGSVDFTSLTLTPATYSASVGAATQTTFLKNLNTDITLFTSNAGGDSGGNRGASTGGGQGGASSTPGPAYSGLNQPGSLGNRGGSGFGGTTLVRCGGGGAGMGSAGSNATSGRGGNGGVGTSDYSYICQLVGIGHNVGGAFFLGGGGGGGRGASGNTFGTRGSGSGVANTGGGGDGGTTGRINGGYSGAIVLRYLKSAVE